MTIRTTLEAGLTPVVAHEIKDRSITWPRRAAGPGRARRRVARDALSLLARHEDSAYEGSAPAKARGQSLGRPSKLTRHQRQEAIQAPRRERGNTYRNRPQLQCQREHDFETDDVGVIAIQ